MWRKLTLPAVVTLFAVASFVVAGLHSLPAVLLGVAINPVLGADPTWHLGTVFVSTAFSALFLGRTAARMRVRFVTIRVAI